MTTETSKFVYLKGEKVDVSASVRNAFQHDRDEDRERKRRKRLEEQGIEIPTFVSYEALQNKAWRDVQSDDDVAETVVQLLMSEQVRKAVSELPEKKRQVIELRFFENMTIREAADVLGIPHSTADSREKSALADLKKMLQKFL